VAKFPYPLLTLIRIRLTKKLQMAEETIPPVETAVGELRRSHKKYSVEETVRTPAWFAKWGDRDL